MSEAENKPRHSEGWIQRKAADEEGHCVEAGGDMPKPGVPPAARPTQRYRLTEIQHQSGQYGEEQWSRWTMVEHPKGEYVKFTAEAPARPHPADPPAATVHDLKTWPEYFKAVTDGAKRFEIRKDDRGFRVGDCLALREYDPITGRYTGDVAYVRVTYLTLDFTPGDMCVMSIEPWVVVDQPWNRVPSDAQIEAMHIKDEIAKRNRENEREAAVVRPHLDLQKLLLEYRRKIEEPACVKPNCGACLWRNAKLAEIDAALAAAQASQRGQEPTPK